MVFKVEGYENPSVYNTKEQKLKKTYTENNSEM